MGNRLWVIGVIVFLMISCSQKQDPYAPPMVTTIDLDEVEKTVEKEEISLKLIYNNHWYENDPTKKDRFIPFITNLSQGLDSTFYVFDFKNSRLVHFTHDGKYLRFIGGPGSGPGEFINPNQYVFQTDQYIYIPDYGGVQLHLFDRHGRYIRTIKNASAGGGRFSIGIDGMIFSTPTDSDDPELKYMILIQDSLGNEIKKIGLIGPNDFLKKRIKGSYYDRERYFVIAGRRKDYLWCVFTHQPIVRRYDYGGRLLEEVRFTSKAISKAMARSESIRKERKIELGGVMLFYNPQSMAENDLLVRIIGIGNMHFTVKDNKTQAVKKYILTSTEILPEKDLNPNYLDIKLLADRFYAYYISCIFLQTNS